MDAKPINVISISSIFIRWGHYQKWIALISLSCIFVGIVGVLSSCNTPATDIQPTKNNVPSLTLIPKPTQTLIPSLTPTPSLTIKPFGTPIRGSTLYNGDSIFEVIDFPVMIETALERLPSGMYIIGGEVDLGSSAEEFNYTSMITDQQGLLLAVGEIINLNSICFNGY